ncbi:hypothetical protein [Nonomuraea sp. SBT364]|uniref:hypothetical protein n=1 Tax=Nonomuraea sp. SBT364 TaxID=1580530 RepID=UPI00066BD3FC|nr:hypothetical protein [Nonomuraea sp. SBT364]
MKKDTRKPKRFIPPKIFQRKKNQPTVQNTGTPMQRTVPSKNRVPQQLLGQARNQQGGPPTDVITRPRSSGNAVQRLPSETIIHVDEADEIDLVVRNQVDSILDDLLEPGLEKPVDLVVGGLPLRVDYTEITKLAKGEEGAYIDKKVAQILKKPCKIGDAFMGTIGVHNEEMAQWLMRALCLIADNEQALTELGVQPLAIVKRLITTAKSQIRMTMQVGEGMELRVLQVGGLMCEKLLSTLSVPDQKTRDWLHTVYNPGRNKARPIGPLDPDLLRQQMTINLLQVIRGEYRVWHTASGRVTEPHKLEDIGKIANFVQGFLKKQYGDYPLAAIDSVYHKGWIYSQQLVSTESKPGDTRELLGWLVNRGDYVGWGKEYGSPYAQANYNPSRPEDKKFLLGVYTELLQNPKFVKYLRVVSQLTACHAPGTGKVMVQPWHHNTDFTSRVNFRWKRARTLIHEFLHVLTHDHVRTVEAGHKQILLEGFTELLTVEVFARLIEDVKTNEESRLIILGDEPYAAPDPGYLELGYADAGVKAQLIAGSVSLDNVKAAYFLGATKFIGL